MTHSPPSDGQLDALLSYIYERRNFDFRGYKRTSLSRRIWRRLQVLGIDDYQRYMDVLEANPGEFAELFNTILINVTSLMRDKDAWDALSALALASIIQTKGPAEPIRIWSAGCASGEEAYTLAVLVAEGLGDERFRQCVKIYATDADTDALMEARRGRYPEKDLLQAFGEARTHRFFELEDGEGTFRPDLRRSLIFGRHDLVQDPPISKIDLLSCRNTLMYFTSEVQQRVLTNFHFALNSGGYLFLGKSEALASRLRLFDPVDLRQHIFRKDGDRWPEAAGGTSPHLEGTETAAGVDDVCFAQSPLPQVLVDAQMHVLAANLAARRLLSIGSAGIGTPLEPGSVGLDVADIAGHVTEAIRERRVVTVTGVPYASRAGEVRSFDVVVAPVEGHAGVTLAFVDVTRYRNLSQDLERSQRELESAYEELQSAVEELETTNEELQSTNEELETTNEELHSTNEELETMNEELQSTNEELETSNTELRDRSAQLDELNTFLNSILASLKSAVIVLGPEMEVRAWNRQAEDLWGLRAEEVRDQHFLNLDIGFPVDVLGTPIRSCLAGRTDGAEVVHEAINRRGRTVECTVAITPLVSDDSVRGVIVLMDASPLDAQPPADDGTTT